MDFSKLSLSELSAGVESTQKIAKTGGKDDGTENKGPYVDPYTLGQAYLTQLGETKGKESNKGTAQLEQQIAQIRDDGTVLKAGRVWIDMPLIGANSTMTADEEATYLEKSGTKFLKFLRAISPENFNVFASVDKSNPKKWVFMGFDGKSMSEKQRDARGVEIDKAVIGVAQKVMSGEVTFTGGRVMLTKVASNNVKYPYLNFSPIA